jgi:hypothetical protein
MDVVIPNVHILINNFENMMKMMIMYFRVKCVKLNGVVIIKVSNTKCVRSYYKKIE